MFRIIIILLCFCLVVSCKTAKEKNVGEPVPAAEEMYNDAVTKLERGRYEKSIERFEELERTYPYSKLATKSQIMSAYASYKDEQYDDALVALERFTKLHPGNEDIEYAYYLRALSFYRQISNVDKDQSYSAYTKSALQELIARFPNSKYANDARLKLDLVNDHLAGKEVDVGRFYQKGGSMIAAINRFQQVIEKYDTTTHVPEALHRLVESYLSLGVRGEAQKYAAVLGYNFPDSKWYKRSYKLLEGKNLKEQTAEEKKGHWYDFTSWSGLKFKKAKDLDPSEDVSEDLVEDIDSSMDGMSEVEKVYNKVDGMGQKSTSKPKKKKSGGFTGWLKGLKLPFTGD